MSKLSPINLAYQYLNERKDNASFEDIWNTISREISGDNDSKNEIIAELYSDLVLDNRFALTSDGKWGLRDYLKFDDVKKQYEYIDKFETTEEFDDLDTEAILGLDTFDDDTGESVGKIRKLLDQNPDDDSIDTTIDDDDDDEIDDEDLDEDDEY
ncbi:DNA-directed RNA polymerase subunit delta [Spiroplasma sp. BIUS-1]|uniref:DNA-directed RNA polymerase subunit delta n=1 Tax=Spiroplasma sp. BIUS-1 TaxID=216964 RepID=UPI00139856D3|nr:DNA-directed RNA polymerase subunit delta [Spiroplasma sp. BIUS-1]QHX37057.1 DNA directed RNA polymerase subunit delta [Spiroplasma sp. BIUS-1]